MRSHETILEDESTDSAGAVITKSVTDLCEPKMFRVLLHNDDFTPMDFVVEVLEQYFGKDSADSHRIMLEVHNKGVGICGVYPREIAETKAIMVSEKAREKQYPLKCTFEEDL